jgi:vitamin B12 transporter
MKKLLVSASALALGASGVQAQGFDLGEIVVFATAVPIEAARTGASVNVATEDDLDGATGLQLSDVLKRQPGVSIVQNGPAGTTARFQIRGAQEEFTAVYVDGIKVNDPSATGGQYGNFGAFAIGAINRVEVLKGSQSALYGGSAVAGVVNIATGPGDDAPMGVTQKAEIRAGSFRTLATSYAYTHKTEDWTTYFSLSHARSDGFSSADENTGNSEDDGFRETRVSFGATWQATDALKIGVNGFHSKGEAEFDEFGLRPQDGTPDETSEREETGLRLFASYETLGGWTHDLAASSFAVDRSQTSPTVGPFASTFASRFKGERKRLEYQASGQINDQLQLSLGADYEKERSEDTNIPGGFSEINTRGAFAEAVYSPSADLDLIGTLRHDDNSQFGGETTGRFAFSYRAQDNLNLRGALATGFRPPVASELYASYPDPLYPFAGNPALLPETSLSMEFGFDMDLAGHAGLGVTLFRNNIDNLIAYSACPVTIDFVLFSCDPGTFSTLRNVTGTSRLEGLELSYDRPLWDNAELSLAYTYTDARDATGRPLPRVAQHQLYLGLDMALTQRLDASLSLTHVANRADDSFPRQALRDYTVVDTSLTYTLTDTTKAYLMVENLFDEQYQSAAGYGTADRAFYVGLRASY